MRIIIQIVCFIIVKQLLKTYEPGRPNMKPDVIKQMVEIEKSRKKEMEKMRAAQQQQQHNQPCITFANGNGTTQQLSLEQVVQVLQQQQNQINQMTELLQRKDEEICRLRAAVAESAI